MKFIYYSDFNLPIDQVISDADISQFIRIEELRTMNDYLNEASVLLLVLDRPISEEILDWRKQLQYQALKIVLISNNLEENYLRNLQIEHSFYDLFFKYPINSEDLTQKIKLISTFTHNTWKPEQQTIEPTLQMAELEIGNLTDQVNPMNSQTGEGETLGHSEEISGVDSLSLVDGLTGEANIDIELNQNLQSEQGLSLEVSGVSGDSGVSALKGNDHSNEDLRAESVLTDALMLGTEEDFEALGEELPDLKSENFLKDLDAPLDLEQVDLEQENPSAIATSGSLSGNFSANVEKVSLNEILENKDDQIYRLMSKNKMLEEEVIEKEEVIKQLQKEIRELQTSYDKNKDIVEESTYQVNVLKSNHEQEKLEIKKNLDVALGKVKLLEARVDELKNSSAHQTRNPDATLTIGELRKLKARQEHLEEKISLLQSDSAIQLQHREKKIIDLKRKVDLLEFDVKDSLDREAELKRKLQQAESKMAQTKQLLKQVMDEPVMSSHNDGAKKTGSYDI